MRQPAIACIYYYSMIHDAKQLERSWKYFHPDIPVVVYDDIYSYKMTKECGISWGGPVILKPLTEDYELVIHLDADSIVTSRCEEILSGDFDVASAKCNNHLGMAGAVNPGYFYKDISIDNYINVGVWAINGEKGREFLNEWIELNKQPESSSIPFSDNGTFNIIFYNGKYKVKILDEDSNPYYYGVSSAWGYNGNHWQSWRQIRLEKNQLYLRHKLIRLLHKAGAGSPDNRFNFDDLFSPEVSKWIKRITN